MYFRRTSPGPVCMSGPVAAKVACAVAAAEATAIVPTSSDSQIWSPTRRRLSRRSRDAVAATVATVGDTVGDTVATVADSVAGLPTASRAFATTYGGDRRAGAIFYLSGWIVALKGAAACT